MKKYIAVACLSLVLAATLFGGVLAAKAETFSTTSLGTAIDTVSGVTYDYFTVLITHFWPFLLGGLLLVIVLGFGIWVVHKFWNK